MEHQKPGNGAAEQHALLFHAADCPFSIMSVDLEELTKRHSAAAEQFNRREHRNDGVRIASSLSGGLTLLRDCLYARVHDEVRRQIGTDSMLAPVSEEKSERVAKLEIELYQIVVSAVAAIEGGHVHGADDWYLQWLSEFRLGLIHADGRVAKRLAYYLSKTADARRMAFSNILATALPESRRAPLVLFRLVTPAVQIATALAFGDTTTADEWRQQQASCLPAIRDCHLCRGKLLDNGEQCLECGNPLWKFDWLVAAD
jgi:hypothetical protein